MALTLTMVRKCAIVVNSSINWRKSMFHPLAFVISAAVSIALFFISVLGIYHNPSNFTVVVYVALGAIFFGVVACFTLIGAIGIDMQEKIAAMKK